MAARPSKVVEGFGARFDRSCRSVACVKTSVTRSFTFEAAHQLPWHPGKCRELHGHGYRLEVTVEGPVGDNGMVERRTPTRIGLRARVVIGEVLDDHRPVLTLN